VKFGFGNSKVAIPVVYAFSWKCTGQLASGGLVRMAELGYTICCADLLILATIITWQLKTMKSFP
jgi:hypothetical protein